MSLTDDVPNPGQWPKKFPGPRSLDPPPPPPPQKKQKATSHSRIPGPDPEEVQAHSRGDRHSGAAREGRKGAIRRMQWLERDMGVRRFLARVEEGPLVRVGGPQGFDCKGLLASAGKVMGLSFSDFCRPR